MNLTQWSPLTDLERLLDRYSPFASRLDDDFPGLKLLNSNISWQPAADITENTKEYLIKADLPEVEREDIHIEITNDRITLKGERKIEKRSEDEKQHRIETFYGRFERMFPIPADVDQDAISAECDKGVLRIHLPKAAGAKPEEKGRKIKVS